MGIMTKKAQPVYDRPSDASTSQAFKNGNTITKVSFFVFGIGNLMNRQIARGLIFLALEIGYFIYLISFGIGALGDLITLGTVSRERYIMRCWGFMSIRRATIPCSVCCMV